MKAVWFLINFFQIIIICIWTAVCAVIGFVLMLFTWNGAWVHKIDGLYIWSPVVCAVCGIRVKIIGKEKIDARQTAIYVANHASHFDIVALARVMPVGLFFIAKKELARVPFLGQYMYLIGHIFIDRNNKEKAMNSMKRAAQKIIGGRNVISFPEGTRSKTGELMLFKRGTFIIAKEGGVDVVPVGIIGSRQILPSGRLSIRPGLITVVIGDRISPKETEKLSVDEMAEWTRNKVKQLLEIKS